MDQGTDLCYVDEESIKALELIENNVDTSNKKHSLFGYLNANTCTTTGARLLRDSILKPSCNLSLIEQRLDCVEYLVNRIDTLSNITNSIKRYGQNLDLNSVAPQLTNLLKTRSATLPMAEKRLGMLTTIEALVTQIIVVVGALETTDQPLLSSFKADLENPAYGDILFTINNVIEPEVKSGRAKRNKMFKIKEGIEKLFDIARNTYTLAINDCEEHVRNLRKDDNLPWKLNYGDSRGYFLSMSVDAQNRNIDLDAKYIRVQRNRTMISCTTHELMQLNCRANVSYENSMKLANEILEDTLGSICNHLGAINKLVEIVGVLDLITCFAKLIVHSHGALVRPRFTAMETLISKSRHPVLESVLSVNDLKVVPNDVTFVVGHKNFMLVTGPNMGGKSIFLKQVALIQIMAQIGCYVPAETAHMKIMDRIVARSGTSDDNSSSCSSFMWEMKGIASALIENANVPNPSVLYIIDEVGRGTSIEDGASFSFAIAEELAQRRNCFTVFATHFDQVFTLTALYRNVVSYYFKYDDTSEDGDNSRLKISHTLVPGIAEKNHYGIRLAEACGLPQEILQVAMNDLGMQY